MYTDKKKTDDKFSKTDKPTRAWTFHRASQCLKEKIETLRWTKKKINVIIQNLCQFNSIPLTKTYHRIENFILKEINVLASHFHWNFISHLPRKICLLEKIQYRNCIS